MDLETFFSEQDQRMNMPDDDLDEYLKRMGYRSSEAIRQISVMSAPIASNDLRKSEYSRLPTVHIDPQTAAHEIHAQETSLSDQHASAIHLPSPCRENLSMSEGYGSQAGPPMRLNTVLSNSNIEAEPTARSLSSSHIPQPLGSVRAPSPLDTAVVYNSYYSENPNSLGILKRKESENTEFCQAEVPQKKRNISPQPASPPSSIEEITSFETNITSNPRGEKRPINLLAEQQQPPDPRQPIKNPKSPKKRKINALKVQTLVHVPVKEMTEGGPLTSPIEDISSTFHQHESTELKNRKKTTIQPAPSRLYLEVKERVAKHATSRRQDRVIRLGKRDPVTSIVLPPDESSIICMSSAPPSRSSSPVPGPSDSMKVKAKRVLPLKSDKSGVNSTKLKKKVKPLPVTPAEYVRHLREKVAQEQEKEPEPGKPAKRSPFKFLQGKSIFYIGGDMTYASERTRGRMDCIVKYGGNLLAAYDPAVTTHIITDAHASSTLRALGLKKLKEIPDHIPTIKWDWVAKAIGRAPITTKEGGLKVRMDELFMHAAFSERIDAGSEPLLPLSKSKGKGKAIQVNEDISHISEFTPDKSRHRSISRSIHDSDDGGGESDEGGLGYSSTGAPPSPPTSPFRPSNRGRTVSSGTSSNFLRQGKTEDPLAEFYAEARAERDSGWSRHGEVDESEVESDCENDDPVPKVVAKRGWTCDVKEVQRTTCVNQDIVDKLKELKGLHESKPSDDDRWRVFSYGKCIRALQNHPKRIESFAEARAIRGVGEKTAAKIMEIIETGGLRRIGYEKTDDVTATRLFQGIYGVGQSTAFKWYAAGCRTLEDITTGKGGIKLTPAQEIGIRFYDDINDRMPREEAKAIFDLIKPIALKIDAKLFVEIMGSYRRGKADCGDIDIIITRPTDDGKTHQGVLPRLLRDLHAAGILTEDLAVPEDPNDLEAIYRGLCRVPQSGARRRRIDFLTVPWKSRGAALLYYTGDDIFNRAIRWKAGAMGFSLNQRGLFSGVVRNPGNRRMKMNIGTLVASETEQEIFKILGVPWQEPHERVRG